MHHYLSSFHAHEIIRERDAELRAAMEKGKWFERVEFSNGMLLPQEFPIRLADDADLARLIERYYDDSIETSHMKKGGDDARLG